VIGSGIPHEGAQRHVPTGYPWWGGGTAWGTSHPHHLRLGVHGAGPTIKDSLRPTWGELKTPWERGNAILEGGGGLCLVVWVHMQMERSLRTVQPGPDLVGGMASRNPFQSGG
jgi:hypothetical protein